MEGSSDSVKCTRVPNRHSGDFVLLGLTCALLLLPTDQACAVERAKHLLADGWHIRQLDLSDPDIARLTQEAARPTQAWLAAKMPAQVHDILLAHGKISDPRIGRNAAESAWVGEKDWGYACTFKSPADISGPVFLHFGGLDTLAKAYLNGNLIGRFDNMYRQYVVDVGSHLSPNGQDNILLIVFSSPLRFIEKIEQSSEEEGIAKAHYLRKCHSDFGSYLGARPHSVKVGVFRDIWLDVPGKSWLDDIRIQPRLSSDYAQATIDITVTTSGSDSSLSWTITSPNGAEVAAGEAVTEAGVAKWQVQLDEPELWWPSTHGTPHLYKFEVKLGDANQSLDRRTIRFGIRDIQPVLEDPATGEKRFRFIINGSPIFLRGACWAPVEGMTHCWDEARANKLLDLMQQGRMNVLRIWAEGNIPPESFYDECDRRGILIWQDFMFGYWAVIDYYLVPKIPYYFLRRAYEPVLVSFERTDDQIAVWVVNDSPEPASGSLTVWRKTFKGQVRGELSIDVELQPGEAKRCLSTTDFGPVYLRTEFLHAEFARQDATHLLIGERYLHLPKAKLDAKLADGKIELSTDTFARQVTLEQDGNAASHFDDNFFDMPRGSTRTIRVLEKTDSGSVSIRALNAEPVQVRW